jgi:hypothetical protein
MKKIYSISILAVIAIVLAVSGVLLVPSGVILADQAFQTVRAPISALDPVNYPLKDGFVVVTHMNGPVNFEKKEFQLHGAKPNTQFFIYREFAELGWTPLYSGDSFWTDKQGNGHIITTLSPTDPNLEYLKSLGIDHLTIKNVLFDGLGGTPAYESETYVTFFDYEWTP